MPLIEPTHWRCRGRCEQLRPVAELDGGLCRGCIRDRTRLRHNARAAELKKRRAAGALPRSDPRSRSPLWTAREIELLKAACAAGDQAVDAAARIGRRPLSVIAKAKLECWPGLRYSSQNGVIVYSGDRCYRTTWNEDRVAELRRLKGLGLRRVEIARQLGVTSSALAGAVYRYLKGSD